MSEIPIISLNQVAFKTSLGSDLLQNLSFQVFSGDRVAIIGASGSGKTTLLKLLNRLLSPTTGNIYFQNEEYKQIPVIKLRCQVVLVPQEPKLLNLTVAETLVYPLVLQQLSRSERQQRLDYWVEKLHLDEDWLERQELQLSLGQRQLIAIARGLMMQPSVLLLDEPTSALDVGKSNHVIEVLKDLTASAATTLIMVTHQLEFAQQFADRVLYLEQGQLLWDIPAPEVNWNQLRDRLVATEAKINQEDW